ncbi:MAG: glycosyltransferase, partial [Methanomassiliicoccales archaeon]|nr:glycosyltransferase [Methanomassiliicoccales archaeon]
VRFLPRKPYTEMPAVYNMADIAISIPNSDSAAASVLEAMSCELAVIVSDIPNMREWVEDGVNGFLTEIDSAKLSEKLIRAREDRARLAEMGSKARSKVLDEKNQGTFESSLKVAERAYQDLMKRVP